MSGAVDWQPLLEKTIIALVSPLGTAWFLGLLAVLLAAWGRRRLAAFMGVLALAWLGVWSLPVASHTLRAAIEAQHPLLAMDAEPRAQAIVVLGGMGSTLGVVLAAFVLTVTPELLRSFAEYRVLLFGMLMVVMMIWRPRGLIRINRSGFAVRKGVAP